MEKMFNLILASLKEEQINRTAETRDNKAFLELHSYVSKILKS